MGNSGSSSSSSFAGTVFKVGTLVAAAGAAALGCCCCWGCFSDSKDEDYQRLSTADDGRRKRKTPEEYAVNYSPPKYSPADADRRKRKTPEEYAVNYSVYSPPKYSPADADRPKRKSPEEYAVIKQIKLTPPDPRKLGKIKLMCYNIWSVDVKLHERMKAISKLIQKHSPDIILFQEVTPFIYKIFQDCNWWGLYKCSVPPEKATRKFFCMLLSKLPVRKSICIHLKNSKEGKGLSVAWINAGEKKLVVATCHLKRPTNSGTNSTERVAQAKEALSFLHSAPNVVLGGDMNWDEDSDGHFPLLGEWYDAWSILRPRENGWTYDTKSNRMLTYSRLVQKRLDRFLCKLKDFQIVSIDMIGMEAIQQISYSSKRKKLPVLPSDHYGLILTVSSKDQ